MKARNNNGTIEYQINGEWYDEKELSNIVGTMAEIGSYDHAMLEQENACLLERINEADEILQELEDYTHGVIGDKITAARLKLKQ